MRFPSLVFGWFLPDSGILEKIPSDGRRTKRMSPLSGAFTPSRADAADIPPLRNEKVSQAQENGRWENEEWKDALEQKTGIEAMGPASFIPSAGRRPNPE